MADVLVLDTSVLIEHERGAVAAATYVTNLIRKNTAAVHPVTGAELLFGARDRSHLRAVQTMLGSLRVLVVRNSDFVVAGDLLERYVLTHRVGWPDCLIAATCQRLGVPLVTMNDKDFRIFRGLKVIRPY